MKFYKTVAVPTVLYLSLIHIYRVTQFYCLHDGVLFVKPKLNQNNWKIMIPRTTEKELVLDYHIRYGCIKGDHGTGGTGVYEGYQTTGSKL